MRISRHLKNFLSNADLDVPRHALARHLPISPSSDANYLIIRHGECKRRISKLFRRNLGISGLAGGPPIM